MENGIPLPTTFDFLTRGHNLNLVKAVPEFIDVIKKHCATHDVYPVNIVSAIFNFIGDGRSQPVQTHHELIVNFAKGKKRVSLTRWAVEQRLSQDTAAIWQFTPYSDPNAERYV